MRSGQLPRTNFISSVRRRGLRQTLVRKLAKMLVRVRAARIMKNVLDYIFDKRHGTRTSGIVTLNELNIDSERKNSGTFYVATPRYEFRNIIAGLGIDTTTYTFVDFGCGMGRVLLYAMDYQFFHVIGIDFSKYLADIARSNISRYSRHYRGPAQVITGDATEFAIPKSPCVLFFFNPFSSTVTSEILLNVYNAYMSGNHDIYHMVQYHVQCGAAFRSPMAGSRGRADNVQHS